MFANMMAKGIRYAFEHNFVQRSYTNDVIGMYDIAYLEDQCKYHLLDVYYPSENQNIAFPLLFNIHGGAWVACDKDMNRAYSEYLTSFGYCVVNMSYRLLPKTDLTGQLEDICSAIHYVIDKLPLAHADKTKIILMGDSAGAHLASTIYCLLTNEYDAPFFKQSMKALPIKAMVLQNTVSDLSDFANSNKWYLKRMCELLYGEQLRDSKIYTKSSFLELVCPQTPKVPIVLVGSEQDPLYVQTVKMEAFLKQNDWKYKSIIWKKTDREGLGHVFQVNHPDWPESQQTHEQVFAYIKEVIT